MKRRMTARLERWAAQDQRLPLLLLGARQVGKTWLVEDFASRHFEHSVVVNFQSAPSEVAQLFARDLIPERIIRDLGLFYGQRIDRETLLVFDEVQLCQPALTALKYFAENLPTQPVIATGSLFGVTVHRDEANSFPVGKVEIARLSPMDFEEFAWATGHELWPDAIRDCFDTDQPFAAHRQAMDLYRQYLMVGGLPAVVAAYIEQHDFAAVRERQRDLAALYSADIGIYLSDTQATRTRAVWDSIPRQLTREQSNKFKLSDIRSGARAHEYELPFAWLEAAGMIMRHYQSAAVDYPLLPRESGSFFKVFPLDVGLLSARLNIPPAGFLDPVLYRQLSAGFRGGIAESYVKQAMTAAGIDSLYWNSGNRAEIDFLISDEQMNIIPIEVKSADNVRSKSLQVYRATYHPRLSIRISASHFGVEDGLKTIPLYAAFCLDPLR